MTDIPRAVSERRRKAMKRRLEVNREKAQKAEHEAVSARREMVMLRKKANKLEEKADRIKENYCGSCFKKIEIVYDFSEEGYVCFCPYCGAKVYYCVECYYDNARSQEKITEYEERIGCYTEENPKCPYETKRGVPRV